jgi:hypothetical protein
MINLIVRRQSHPRKYSYEEDSGVSVPSSTTREEENFCLKDKVDTNTF